MRPHVDDHGLGLGLQRCHVFTGFLYGSTLLLCYCHTFTLKIQRSNNIDLQGLDCPVSLFQGSVFRRC